MALRFCDSFDHYVTADLNSKYTTVTGAGVISAGNGRNSTAGFRTSNHNNALTKTIDAQATWIVGFAMRINALPSSTQGALMTLMDGAIVHVTLQINPSGLLEVRRGTNAGTLLATGSTVLATNTFYYIEMKITISDAAGAVVIHINSVAETLTFVSGTATTQDTRNAGNASANIIAFPNGASSLSTNVDYDDLYVCDSTGGTNNDFLGDVRVEALFPNGDGNSSQLVGSDGNSVNNSLLVDETAPNSDTDYVESSTVSDKDTYAYSNMTPTAGTVAGVQVLPFAKKTDAGARSIVSVARLSATEVDSAAKTLNTTYGYLPDVRETKPGGGAWAVSDVNSAEFGVKVNA